MSKDNTKENKILTLKSLQKRVEELEQKLDLTNNRITENETAEGRYYYRKGYYNPTVYKGTNNYAIYKNISLTTLIKERANAEFLRERRERRIDHYIKVSFFASVTSLAVLGLYFLISGGC